MNHFSFFKTLGRYRFVFFFMVFTSLIFSSCKQEPQVWKLKSQEQVAGDYIASNPDQFSEFEKLIEVTGTRSLLNIRGPYTVFVPNNDAMVDYYKQKNVNSFMDFDEKFRVSLVRNHIITNEITTGDIGLGALRDTNAIGDYLVTEFHGADIIVDKYSKIIKRDIRTANGYIHVIDKVLDPVTKDIYSVIDSDGSYKIFAEGLRLTGIKDTLQIIRFPYGKKAARTRFTVLAVPDSVYNSQNIFNVGDLIKWCGANPDSLTFLNNPFYRYMEYHCMNGTFYTSDFKTGIYSILSRDNNISVRIDNDYKLNLDLKTQKYTGLIIPASNTPAKNGALHAINRLLPVTDPEPAVIIFETTDFFDLKQGDYYGKYFKKWSDSENTFAKIRWVGDFMQYYYYPTATILMNNDCLQIMGWWTFSITFPKVMKGKYDVSIFQPNWQDVTTCNVYIDGKLTGLNYFGPRTGGPGGLQKIASVDFKTTIEHTITLTNIAYGMVFWDYVRFDPIK